MPKRKRGQDELLQALTQLFNAYGPQDRSSEELAQELATFPLDQKRAWWVALGDLSKEDLSGEQAPTMLMIVELGPQSVEPQYLDVLEEGGPEEAYRLVLELLLEHNEGLIPATIFTPQTQTAFALGNLLRETEVKVEQGGPPELLALFQEGVSRALSDPEPAFEPQPFLTTVPEEEVKAYVSAFEHFMTSKAWKRLPPDRAIYAAWTAPDGQRHQVYATVMGDAGESFGVSFFPDAASYSIYVLNAMYDQTHHALTYTGGMEAVSQGQEQEFAPEDWAILKRLKLVKRGRAPSLLRLSLSGHLPLRTPLRLVTGLLQGLGQQASQGKGMITRIDARWEDIQVVYPALAELDLQDTERRNGVLLTLQWQEGTQSCRFSIQVPAHWSLNQVFERFEGWLTAQEGLPEEVWCPSGLFLIPQQNDPFEAFDLLCWEQGQELLPLTAGHLARLGRAQAEGVEVQARFLSEPVSEFSAKVEEVSVQPKPKKALPASTKSSKSKTGASAPAGTSGAKWGDGMCRACGQVTNKAGMTKHQAKCEGRVQGSAKEDVFRLRVSGGGPYWLDLELKASATLDDLDDFLRGIWLECCGHLSEFSIGPQMDFDSPFAQPKKQKQPKLSELLRVGQKFGYTYDFGSSTELELSVQAREQVNAFKGKVRLLARNIAPSSPCAVCGQPATQIHSWEYDEQTGGPLMHCDQHTDEEALDDGAYLPIVNSPRAGVCAYDGGNDDAWPPGTVSRG